MQKSFLLFMNKFKGTMELSRSWRILASKSLNQASKLLMIKTLKILWENWISKRHVRKMSINLYGSWMMKISLMSREFTLKRRRKNLSRMMGLIKKRKIWWRKEWKFVLRMLLWRRSQARIWANYWIEEC